MRPLLGWLPLEVAKWTIGCTIQLAMGFLISIPLRQHHKSRTPQLNVPRLTETFATDILYFLQMLDWDALNVHSCLRWD